MLGGIEIYKGKPIFYSLGSFFFEFGGTRSYKVPGGMLLRFSDAWFQTAVPVVTYRRGEVSEIRLYPMSHRIQLRADRRAPPAGRSGGGATDPRAAASHVGSLRDTDSDRERRRHHSRAGVVDMTRTRYRRVSGLRALWPAAALALLGAAPALLAANPADDAPLVTQHGVRIDDQELAYTAEVGRVAIRDVETGQPHGYMFYTAYRGANRLARWLRSGGR